jgi:hypothetical protein
LHASPTRPYDLAKARKRRFNKARERRFRTMRKLFSMTLDAPFSIQDGKFGAL